MQSFELFGWAAVGLTLLTYSQRTMLPLRILAISANLCFITWSASADVQQTLALHATLLPFNLYRLWEILRMRRKERAIREDGKLSLDWLRPLLRSRRFADGAYIFRKGDPPDDLYYLVSGTVVFEEVNRCAIAGDLFGEVAFFTNQRERTASARCEGPCEVLAISEGDFTKLLLQDPHFNLHVVRLLAERLADDAISPARVWPPEARAAE